MKNVIFKSLLLVFLLCAVTTSKAMEEKKNDAVTQAILRIFYEKAKKSFTSLELEGNEISLSKNLFSDDAPVEIKIYFGSAYGFKEELEEGKTPSSLYDYYYLKRLIVSNIQDKDSKNYSLMSVYPGSIVYKGICSDKEWTRAQEKTIPIDGYTSCSNVLTFYSGGYGDKNSRGGAVLHCVTKIPNNFKDTLEEIY